MKLAQLLLVSSLLASPAVFAAEPAKAKADYPLTTCLVSDEKLGGMGDPIEHLYKEKGKPDRLVLFCCKDCVADFEKEPAKYLKKLDDAVAAKAAAKK